MYVLEQLVETQERWQEERTNERKIFKRTGVGLCSSGSRGKKRRIDSASLVVRTEIGVPLQSKGLRCSPCEGSYKEKRLLLPLRVSICLSRVFGRRGTDGTEKPGGPSIFFFFGLEHRALLFLNLHFLAGEVRSQARKCTRTNERTNSDHHPHSHFYEDPTHNALTTS